MIYRKPNKVCDECRSRKIKCDTSKPSCGQCIRAGRSCSGYPTLIFRHQTDKIRFHHGERGRLARSSSGSTAPLVPVHRIASKSVTKSTVSKSLFPSTEDQAISFFFQNYVLEEASIARGYFDYLPALYAGSAVNPILTDAVLALGLAGLSNYRHGRTMLDANMRYTRAVKTISASLANVDQAKDDQILIAVLLLGLFETTACDTPRSIKSWLQHINGSMALLQLRGPQQIHTHIGRRLFYQIRTQILTKAHQTKTRVPEYVMQWSTAAREYETADERNLTDMVDVIIKVANFRADMVSRQDQRNSAFIVSEVLALDAQLIDWASSRTSGYGYQVVSIPKRTMEVFKSHFFLYSSVRVAATWDNYRCTRIMLHETLISRLTYLSQLHSNLDLERQLYESQIETSRLLIQSMARDVCASVPFYFDFHKRKLNSPTDNPLKTKAINGNFLLWSLHAVVVAGNMEESMRLWILGRIQAINEAMGIRHASALVKLLRARREKMRFDGELGKLIDKGGDEWEGAHANPNTTTTKGFRDLDF